MNSRAYLALATPVFCWGVAPAFIRSFSQTVGAWDSMFIRLVSVELMSLPFLFYCGAYVARRDIPRLLLVSWVGMFGYFLGSIFGFEYIPAGIGSIIIAIQPLIIALFAAALGTDRLTLATLLGLVVSLIGTIYLFNGDAALASFDRDALFGAGMLMLCNVAFSINVVFSRPLVQSYGAMRVTILTMVLAGIPALFFYTGAVPGKIMAFGKMEWWSLFFLGFVGTILVVILWNYAVGQLRPVTVGASLYAIPVLGVLSGWLVLDERITIHTVLAGLVILAGVAIAEFAKEMPGHGKLAAIVALLFSVTMWGLVPVGMRFLLTDTTPATAMVLRLYPAGIVAVLWLIISGMRPIAWADWLRISLAALIGNGAYQMLAAHGIDGLPASWTGMLFGLEPVFIALFAIVFTGERLTGALALGLLIALAGCAVLVMGSQSGIDRDVTTRGVVLVGLSTLGWGIYTTLIRPMSARYGPVTISNVVIAITAIPVMLWGGGEAVQAARTLDATQWAVALVLAVLATVLAIAAWNYALGHMDSSLAGMFLYVQPIVAAMGGILLLHEKITSYLLAGGVLIILGVVVSQFGGRLARNDGLEEFEYQR